MPVPKRQKQDKVVRMYVTPIYFRFLDVQAKKRNVSVSQLCKLALFDYFNPRYEIKEAPIIRIDRTPKGAKTNNEHRSNFKECMNELKEVFAKKRAIIDKNS